MKLLGDSSPKSTAVSLDLLNLYVVNQISTKKDNTGELSLTVFWLHSYQNQLSWSIISMILVLDLPLIP